MSLVYPLCPLLAACIALSVPPAIAAEVDRLVFQDTTFWNNIYRLTNSSENDWFQQWRDPMISSKGGQNLADVILPHLNSLGSRCDLQLLHIGCGTSSMPAQMLQDGFVQQVCIDSSDVSMTARSTKFASLKSKACNIGSPPCKKVPSLQFLTRDAANTGLGSNSFDIIIDKGTLDAQLGGPKGMPEVVGTVAEVVRLLRIDGVYVQISHSDKRGPLLDESFDGLLQPWHLGSLDASEAMVPFSVLTPTAYIQGKERNDTLLCAQPQGGMKDTTYVYFYRKTGPARIAL